MRRVALALLGGFGGLAAPGVAWCATGAAVITSISPITIDDDRGKTVSLARPATRIVTLSPHLAGIAFAAAAGASLVGVSAHTVCEQARAVQGRHG